MFFDSQNWYKSGDRRSLRWESPCNEFFTYIDDPDGDGGRSVYPVRIGENIRAPPRVASVTDLDTMRDSTVCISMHKGLAVISEEVKA